jgi:hypothetical protein
MATGPREREAGIGPRPRWRLPVRVPKDPQECRDRPGATAPATHSCRTSAAAAANSSPRSSVPPAPPGRQLREGPRRHLAPRPHQRRGPGRPPRPRPRHRAPARRLAPPAGETWPAPRKFTRCRTSRAARPSSSIVPSLRPQFSGHGTPPVPAAIPSDIGSQIIGLSVA